MPDNQAQDYAKEVVLSDLEEPGDDDVVRKLLGDFESNGIDMDEQRLRKEVICLMAEAGRQIEVENVSVNTPSRLLAENPLKNRIDVLGVISEIEHLFELRIVDQGRYVRVGL